MAKKEIKSDDHFGFEPSTDEDLGFEPANDSSVGFEASQADQLPWYVSAPKAAVLGGAQGASFGLADEAQGGIGVLGESIKRALQGQGALDPALADVYQQKRDEARGMYKQAQEEFPVMYGMGEVGAAFIPGVGSLGALGKAEEGSNLIARMAKSGATGAGLGGVAGFGYSEADNPEQLGQDVLKGAELGGGIGAAIPAGVSALSGIKQGGLAVANKLGTVGKSLKAGVEGHNIATEAAASKTAINAIQDPARDIQSSLFGQLDKNFEEKMAILKGEGASMVNFDKLYQEVIDLIDSKVGAGLGIDEAEQMKKAFGMKFLKSLPEEYRAVGYKRVTERYSPGENGELTLKSVSEEAQTPKLPRNAGDQKLSDFELRTREESPIIRKDINPETMRVTGQTVTKEQQIDAIKAAVLRGDIPAEDGLKFVQDIQNAAFETKIKDPTKASIYKGIASKASDVVEGVNKSKLEPLNAQSSQVYKVFDLLNDVEPSKKQYLSQKLMSIIQDIDKPADAKKAEMVREFMDELQKALPDKAEALQAKATIGADLARLAKEVGGGEIQTATQDPKNIVLGALGGVKNIAARGANVAGLAMNKMEGGIERAMTPGVKSGLMPIALQKGVGSEVKQDQEERYKTLQDKVYKATDDDLLNYAQKIQTIDPNVSKALNEAVEMNDMNRKNQVLFNIMQKPNLRREFGVEE